MSFTSDPIFDAHCHDDELEERLRMRPVCQGCKEHIQEDEYWFIPTVGVMCKECLDSEFKEYIEEE